MILIPNDLVLIISESWLIQIANCCNHQMAAWDILQRDVGEDKGEKEREGGESGENGKAVQRNRMRGNRRDTTVLR